MYIPVFTLLQFFFYAGWLKVWDILMFYFYKTDHLFFIMTFLLHSAGWRADHQPVWWGRRWFWNQPADWPEHSGCRLMSSLFNKGWKHPCAIYMSPLSWRCPCLLWMICTRTWLQWWKTNTGRRGISPYPTLYPQHLRPSNQLSRAPPLTWGEPVLPWRRMFLFLQRPEKSQSEQRLELKVSYAIFAGWAQRTLRFTCLQTLLEMSSIYLWMDLRAMVCAAFCRLAMGSIELEASPHWLKSLQPWKRRMMPIILLRMTSTPPTW